MTTDVGQSRVFIAAASKLWSRLSQEVQLQSEVPHLKKEAVELGKVWKRATKMIIGSGAAP